MEQEQQDDKFHETNSIRNISGNSSFSFGKYGEALVSVVMGSDSDLIHMKDGLDILKKIFNSI